jgi:hypothetical protein
MLFIQYPSLVPAYLRLQRELHLQIVQGTAITHHIPVKGVSNFRLDQRSREHRA